MVDVPLTCVHCGSRLKEWRVPDGATWDEEFFYVCFNDECPYYKHGYVWMKEQYNQTASYRYAFNPAKGTSFPLPTWSDEAMREMIVEEDEEGEG